MAQVLPEDLRHWIALSQVEGLGSIGLRALLQRFSSPDAILAAHRQALLQVVRAPVADAIVAGQNQAAIDETLAWLALPGNGLITLADADYPALLLETADPPPLLYLSGHRSLLSSPAMAMVGSRNASPQGVRDAEAFAAALGEQGWCIVSGLALGIDAAAHRGGLQTKGSTIAVIGTGIDRVYPARHRDLAHRIRQDGLLVSEFPLGTRPHAGHFPRRNRIIAGLSRGCLVVEANVRSGSLLTARMAAELGRDVFAIPGSIHSPLSRGCHALIKQGAKLVESAADILEEFGVAPRGAVPTTPTGECMENPEARLLEQMGFDPIDLDVLAQRSGLTVDSLCAMLLSLELAGLVATLPGGRFQRLA